MAFARLQAFRILRRGFQESEVSSLFCVSGRYLSSGTVASVKNGYSRSKIFSSDITNGFAYRSLLASPVKDGHERDGENVKLLQSIVVGGFAVNGFRFMSTQVKAPPQIRQTGAMKVALLSPGFVYEPYKPREPISFWRRWFTRRGWKRTKEDCILELKNAYAVAKLRKLAGYSRQQFYKEALQLYKEINSLMAKGDKTSLRKAVTENMYSILKHEIKQRESMWPSVYWELVEPAVKIRTLRARMIAVDKNDLDKAFVQLTLDFLTKQKFEAYNSAGSVVSGDKTKEVLVHDIWVFERSLFHPGSYWRLCGRISL
ncbi:uncharacterized protein LOC116264143 isoform X1 [Nymphaea colorata]|uniref:uncharacterized protein LOC116264143 isoform X1 n=1 Tax=Nymphaea colorata TaxID=210225 RepID=UPI00129EB676|nr:uncharacterized protein LOC116264143 isoform X1 [Nymphaea colorata]